MRLVPIAGKALRKKVSIQTDQGGNPSDLPTWLAQALMLGAGGHPTSGLHLLCEQIGIRSRLSTTHNATCRDSIIPEVRKTQTPHYQGRRYTGQGRTRTTQRCRHWAVGQDPRRRAQSAQGQRLCNGELANRLPDLRRARDLHPKALEVTLSGRPGSAQGCRAKGNLIAMGGHPDLIVVEEARVQEESPQGASDLKTDVLVSESPCAKGGERAMH